MEDAVVQPPVTFVFLSRVIKQTRRAQNTVDCLLEWCADHQIEFDETDMVFLESAFELQPEEGEFEQVIASQLHASYERLQTIIASMLETPVDPESRVFLLNVAAVSWHCMSSNSQLPQKVIFGFAALKLFREASQVPLPPQSPVWLHLVLDHMLLLEEMGDRAPALLLG